MVLSPLNLISICTGGAGLDLGFELAIPGARSVCMVEREAFACAELVAAMEQGLLSQAALWSDARTFDGRPWRGLVDGLIGGIPCQPHSLAGRKGGSNDPRDLWSTARRIIVQSRARLVLIENVSGMLSAGADEIAGAERVWRDLRKLGYAVEGGLFTASEVGASHRRERLFILGVADTGCEQWREGGAGGRGADWSHAQSSGSGAELSGTLADGDGLEGIGTDIATPRRKNARRQAGLRDRTALVHAERSERRTDALGGHESYGHDDGRDQAAGWAGEPGKPLGDTAGAGSHAGAFAGAGCGDEGAGPRHAQSERRGGDVVDAEIHGLGKGRSEPAVWRGRNAAAGASDAMGDADIVQLRGEQQARKQPELQQEYGAFGPYLFPPGPHDHDGWRNTLAAAPELEPSFRRVADGLASRMDIARVDRLRLLGNGVVPLEAAYAICTLIARLAARGSRGAAQLVRMMEGME